MFFLSSYRVFAEVNAKESRSKFTKLETVLSTFFKQNTIKPYNKKKPNVQGATHQKSKPN